MRKYVIAKTLRQALKAEPKAPVNEIFVATKVDDDRDLTAAIGFEYDASDEKDD